MTVKLSCGRQNSPGTKFIYDDKNIFVCFFSDMKSQWQAMESENNFNFLRCLKTLTHGI